MPQYYFQKPENALKRASELLDVEKKQDALDTLHDVIKSRRHRTWTKIHEQIMTKHLELCVDLRKPHVAKDALFQYRNMCQTVNVKSLETVILFFLTLAEKKAEDAKEQSHGMVEEIIDDLDQAESPETLLLKIVSGEGAQDRADRTVLSPWLKFLWESYRQCLELLRNNVQVETLYHKVARQAFDFCLKYQRRAEFKKLCDNLRSHLNQLQKMQNQTYSPKLTVPETIAYQQETRLKQLDIAIKMELWQEAYKSIEDVYNLMQLNRRVAKPQVMADYYEKVALIFWKAGNTLFHAASLYKLFLLFKEHKKSFAAEEASLLATRVLLASLAASPANLPSTLARHLDTEEQHLEHTRKLTALLGLPSPPTRVALLKEIQRFSVHAIAAAPAQSLYQVLQHDFAPLKLARNVDKLLTDIEGLEGPNPETFKMYVPVLKEVAAVKTLIQVSQVYHTISLKRLRDVVHFFDDIGLERIVVKAAKKGNIQTRLDHRNNCLVFGSSSELSVGSHGASSQASVLYKESSVESPVVQEMPSDKVRLHLQEIYIALKTAVAEVDTTAKEKTVKEISTWYEVLGYHARDLHKSILERKSRIEFYKEDTERRRNEQMQKEAMFLDERERERKREEEARLRTEREKRDEQLKIEDAKSRDRKIKLDRIERLKSTATGREIIDLLDESELETMDAEALLQKQLSHMEKERRELQAKLKQQEKKWDHSVRAIHTEEITHLEREYENEKDDLRARWDAHQEERVALAEKEHLFKVETHNRLMRVAADAKAFLETQKSSRKDQLAKLQKEHDEYVAQEKQRRLEQRKEDRKAARKAEYDRKKREEKERAEAEARRLQPETPAGGPRDRQPYRPPGSGPGTGGGAGGPGEDGPKPSDGAWRPTHLRQPGAPAAAAPPPGRDGDMRGERPPPGGRDPPPGGRDIVRGAGVDDRDRDRSVPDRGERGMDFDRSMMMERDRMGGDRMGDRGGERRPMDRERGEREPFQPSRADEEDNWRRGAAPPERGPPVRSQMDAGPPAAAGGRYRPPGSRDMDREGNMPRSEPPARSAWTRGEMTNNNPRDMAPPRDMLSRDRDLPPPRDMPPRDRDMPPRDRDMPLSREMPPPARQPPPAQNSWRQPPTVVQQSRQQVVETQVEEEEEDWSFERYDAYCREAYNTPGQWDHYHQWYRDMYGRDPKSQPPRATGPVPPPPMDNRRPAGGPPPRSGYPEQRGGRDFPGGGDRYPPRRDGPPMGGGFERGRPRDENRNFPPRGPAGPPTDDPGSWRRGGPKAPPVEPDEDGFIPARGPRRH